MITYQEVVILFEVNLEMFGGSGNVKKIYENK